MFTAIENKIYINQSSVIGEINKLTGYPKSEVYSIFNALSNIIIDKASTVENETEIKICNGIRIVAKYRKLNNIDINLCKDGYMNDNSDRLSLKAKFSDTYKKKIKNKRNHKMTVY